MDGAFGARKHRRPVINITPLIDVMFLLLIFFMVSSTFREQLGIDVTLPRAGSGEVLEERQRHEVTVKASGDIYFGQRRVTDAELKEALAALVAEDPEVEITLRADADAKVQRWVTVIDLAREAGGGRLIIPTQPLSAPEVE